eukprot:gene9637-10652_t
MESYDAFIIDQWGVLHNGKRLYDNAVLTCLHQLSDAGKKMVLLSNSSRRKASVLSGLTRLGIDSSLFIDVVTSGEVAWKMLKDRDFDLPLDKGALDGERQLSVFLLGNGDDDREYLESSGCVSVSPEQADLVVARGTFSIGSHLHYADSTKLMREVKPLLEVCARKKLPMLVTNPDLLRPGGLTPMPGQLALLYAEIAPFANIQYIGKPHGLVYKECLNSLSRVPADRICCIGDSMDHDIAGAVRQSLDSVWIMSGVHCKELNMEEGSAEIASDEALESLLNRYDFHPTYCCPSFR